MAPHLLCFSGLAIFIGLNSMGSLAVRDGTFANERFTPEDALSVDWVLEFGCPFVYFQRPSPTHFPRKLGQCLIGWNEILGFAPMALAGNASIFACLVFITKRLAMRPGRLQISLAMMLVLVSCIAWSLATVEWHAELAERESRFMHAIDQRQNVSGLAPSTLAIREHGGITALRMMFPGRFWNRFDHVLSVNCHADLIEDAARLTRLRHLALSGELDSKHLCHLEDLDRLEYLDVSYCFARSSQQSPGGEFDLPTMTLLKRLDAENSEYSGENLNAMKGLRILNVSCTRVSEREIRQLSKLTELEQLRIGGLQLNPKVVQELQNSLPTCDVIAQGVPCIEF